jgi:hypothetical protein
MSNMKCGFALLHTRETSKERVYQQSYGISKERVKSMARLSIPCGWTRIPVTIVNLMSVLTEAKSHTSALHG